MDREHEFDGTTVLVTGASGFIGEHLCGRLKERGARVTGLYRRNLPSSDAADWLRIDLNDFDAVQKVIHRVRPDVIYHLASHVTGSRELDSVIPTFENNLSTTVHLLTAAAKAQCCKRIVLTNSVEEPERGNPDAVPASPYAASKFAASAYARMFDALYALPVVIARVFMVYGPAQKNRRKLVPYTILKALEGHAPELSSGLRKVDWIYVDDVVAGLLRLGTKKGLEGETIELGSGVFHTVGEVVEEILQQVDPELEGRFGARPDRPMERERLANVEETQRRTDWRATVTLEEGIARTIAWYRRHRD
jgi:nucleoside-diphosphate-sugar epimerase